MCKSTQEESKLRSGMSLRACPCHLPSHPCGIFYKEAPTLAPMSGILFLHRHWDGLAFRAFLTHLPRVRQGTLAITGAGSGACMKWVEGGDMAPLSPLILPPRNAYSSNQRLERCILYPLLLAQPWGQKRSFSRLHRNDFPLRSREGLRFISWVQTCFLSRDWAD